MAKRLPEFDDIKGMERFTGGDYHAGLNAVVYASNQNGIRLKYLADGSVISITAGGRAEGNPRFAADGSQLLFLSAGAEGRQLYTWQSDNGEIKQVSHFPGPILEPLWSPDGSRILFASSVSSSTPQIHRPDEAVVIEDYMYKFDGLGFIRPDGHQCLFLLELSSGEVKKLTPDGQADYLHAAWSPDGRSVVCVSDAAHGKDEMLMYDLYRIDVQKEHLGELRQISHDLPIVSYPNPMRPVVTPDSRSVIMGAMNANADFNLGYPEIFLYAFDMETGESRCLFEQDEDCYQCVQFPYNANCGWGMDKLQISEDGQTVYFHAGWQGQGILYELSLSGNHHARKLLHGKRIYHGASSVQDQKMMVVWSAPDTPETYSILNLSTGSLTDAVCSAENLLREIRLQPTEDFFFDTEDGEGRVHGFVVAPFDMEEGKKYPAFLYVHGGPHPFYTYGLTMEMQAFAAAGFGVIFCNPRGSSGYGMKHQNQKQAMDGTAMRDVLQFTEECVARFEWIDPDRIGATGGSYGGYMTNELAIRSNRFKAYIAQRSMPNNLISYCSTDLTSPESRKYDSYEEFMLEKNRESQISYTEKISRPYLILHGEDDYRTPVEAAHQLFVALRDIHPEVPCRLVIFPHTAHDQPSEPRLARRYYAEMVSWFRKYL